MAATTALREALNKGICSGNLVDTKIILYSRRDPRSGRVFCPKALYASSHVLKTVPYFNDMLFGNFAESQSRDFNEAIDEEEFAEDYGYLSDSDLEDHEASKPKPGFRSEIHRPNLSGKNEIICEAHEEYVEKGKVVKIPDVAFVTFQAFLMYLYTGVIEFTRFGQEWGRSSRNTEIAKPPEDKVPSSPKSIYRLADKYDVPALKSLALDRINDELSRCNIVEESFSRFASQYEELRCLHVKRLAYIWVEDWTGDIRTKIENKIDNFIGGDIQHAAEMVSALWKVVNEDGDIESPPSFSVTATRVESPDHWSSVKIALINSIRRGDFFDRKYWARHSAFGEVLKPVYFSSIIMKDKTEQMNRLIKYLLDQDTLMSDLGGSIDIESDCEGDPLELGGGAQRKNEHKREPVGAVFLVGSFSAWKSCFFYRCTDDILFAPLKSQGVDSRSKYIHEKTVAAVPPPCSPKSIYLLANLLEIKPLCNTALADIRGKVNVVDEVLSWVTAAQKKIAEKESETFIPNLEDPKLIGFVSENMGRIADGSSSKLAGAMKLGLKKAVEFKRRRNGVSLRCPRNGCARNIIPVSRSSVGSNRICPNCSNSSANYYMQCTGCGYRRTSNYDSCLGCKKRFV